MSIAIVTSLALLSSTTVVAIVLLGVVQERSVVVLRRRVATISRQARARGVAPESFPVAPVA